jgi:hypothetical protein
MRSWEPPFIGTGNKLRGRRWYSMVGNSGHLWCQLWGEEEGAVPFNGGKWKKRAPGWQGVAGIPSCVAGSVHRRRQRKQFLLFTLS